MPPGIGRAPPRLASGLVPPMAGAAVIIAPSVGTQPQTNGCIDITVAAGIALGGHRVIRLARDGAALPASSDSADCACCLGVSLGAAAAGAQLVVRRLGEIDDPSFAFAVGAVWLGLAGALTQVRPASGVLIQIAFALGPTRLFVQPQPATILAP